METHNSTADTSVTEPMPHLVALLRDFDTATLITRDRAGDLHARPMSVASVDDDATMWFFTSNTSTKVHELLADERTLVSLQGPTCFAALNGCCDVDNDPAKIEALWKESYRTWYAGKDDPDLVLLRFTPYDAEYWDNSGVQGLKYILRAAKAYISGRPLKRTTEQSDDPSIHAKLAL